VDGEYLFSLRLNEAGVDGGIVGVTEERQQIDLSIDSGKVASTAIGGPEFARGRGAYQRPVPAAQEPPASPQPAASQQPTASPQPSAPQQAPAGPEPAASQQPGGRRGQPPPAQQPGLQTQRQREERDAKILESLKFRVPMKAGEHLVQAYFVAKTSAPLEDLFDPYLRRDPYRAGNGEPGISSLMITPPAAASAVDNSPTRRKLFVCRPATAAEEAPCAKKILATLARRAYRRPITDADLDIPLARYRDGAKSGGFESGLEMALRSVLVS